MCNSGLSEIKLQRSDINDYKKALSVLYYLQLCSSYKLSFNSPIGTTRIRTEVFTINLIR